MQRCTESLFAFAVNVADLSAAQKSHISHVDCKYFFEPFDPLANTIPRVLLW